VSRKITIQKCCVAGKTEMVKYRLHPLIQTQLGVNLALYMVDCQGESIPK